MIKEIITAVLINYFTGVLFVVYGSVRLIGYMINGLNIPENKVIQHDLNGLVTTISSLISGILIICTLIWK